MPNFFQKLTGSLKVEEDNDDIKEDRQEEQSFSAEDDAQNETTGEDPSQAGSSQDNEVKDDGDNTESQENSDLLASSDEEEESGEVLDGDELDSEPGPLAVDEEVSEGEEDENAGPGTGTYTIAQLASATTKSRKGASSETKKRFASLRPSKEDSEKQEDSISSRVPEGQLAIDVYETPTRIVIKSTIAGVRGEDLDIGIEDNTVNIRGSRHSQEKIKSEDYFYQECYWGTFSRSIILPVEVDSDKAEAALKDGILTISLPKIIKEKEKKIKIVS